jgi:hypothetical protein
MSFITFVVNLGLNWKANAEVTARGQASANCAQFADGAYSMAV